MKFFPAMLAVLCPWGALAEPTGWTPVHPVPVRLPVERDALGFSWQLTSAGSFYTTGGNVFESANQLHVNGERFTAGTMERKGGSHRFTSSGAGFTVRREIWLDRDRAAAFCVEEVDNPEDEPREVVLEVTTVFTQPLKGWSARDGQAVVNAGPLPPATGAFLTFPPREGESDLIFLLGDERAAVRPRVSAEDRTFRVRYETRIPGKGSLRLLHGVGQRRLAPGTGATADVFAPFFRENRWIGLEGVGAAANFPDWHGFPGAGEGAGGAVWELTGGRAIEVREVSPATFGVIASIGRLTLRLDEIVRFERDRWTLRDGSEFRGVIGPEQTVRVVGGLEGSEAIEILLPEVRSIRSDRATRAEGGRLRLRNGDRFAGRPVGESWAMRVDGVDREVVPGAVRWLGARRADGGFRVELDSGEGRSVVPVAEWLEWERDGQIHRVPWEWIEDYEAEG